MKWLATGVGIAAFSLAISGQDPLADWVLRLSRVKVHLKGNFERMPNYVCAENVDRYQKTPKRGLVKIDSLEFEVAEVDHKELIAPTGANGFEDRDLGSFMFSGILGTGAFAALPINLFVADAAIIRPHSATAGESGEGWSYAISAFRNAFRITTPGATVTVGVRGTFWVDPDNMDLLRVEEAVVDPPPQTNIAQSGSRVDYARMQIGKSNVLLPRSAALTVVNLDGGEFRNEIQFSNCREYGADSTVRFGDSVPVKKK